MSEASKVFVLSYTHKHGEDYGVHRSYEGALKTAYEYAAEQVDTSWDEDEQKQAFDAFEDKAEALAYFHSVESENSYGEIIEITETTLRD